MLAIRLEPEIEKRLAALAKKTGRTKTFYARQAITDQLENLEDYYLAEQRFEEHVRSGDAALTTADLKKKHGLAG